MFVLIAGEVSAQCTAGDSNEFKNLGSTVNLSDYINCPGGDVVLNTVGSDAGGNGQIIFDQNFNFNSITINFQNGNKPAEFIIPSGITVTITTDMTFTGQVNKDKFLTVNGTLIVGNELDFGGIEFEIDGTGSIDAESIIGADDVSCVGPQSDGTCPIVSSDSCNDGSGDFCDTALPVTLVSFDVSIAQNKVTCVWVTSTEENNDYFTIERSKDGSNYEAIGVIAGAGNSNAILRYQLTDENPLFGTSYYRLVQTDLDGTSETFNAKSIYRSNVKELVVQPNPVERGSKLTVYTGAEEGEVVELSIFSASGTKLINRTVESISEVEIGAGLEPGLYIVKVQSGANQHVKRLLIK
ncbi:MAG: T9SS type A sorting domain-containing protein [Fulvivirga sp.]